MRRLRPHAAALAAGLAELVFLAGIAPGLALLAVLAGEPALLAGGLAGWAGAWLLDRLAAAGTGRPLAGGEALNPLLAGLAAAHLTGWCWDLPALAAGCGAAALALGRALAPMLRNAGLPALSLPFSLVAVALGLAASRWGALPAAGADHGWLGGLGADLPGWLRGLLASLGALLFLPLPAAGAGVAILLAWRSRILLVLAIAGWAAGALLHLWLRGDPAAWERSDGFNAMLAAMAVGGVFLVPSWRSLLLALAAAAGCTALGDALAGWWAGAAIPPFTLPFCATVLVTLRMLAGSPLLAASPGTIPEDTLAAHWAWRARFPGSLRSLAPPFAGAWTVWQGEDGRWTHRGAWRHALDFVIVGDDGRTCRSDGRRCEDYHAFGQAVLSPVDGRVVAVVDGVPDAEPGHPDQDNRWGNLVVIHDARGFWVEISHLACRSLAVAPGAWVERGQFLGRCGNSGYSPQPHIHLQVQGDPAVGAATLPFSLASWWGDGRFRANEMPRDGEAIEPLRPDPRLEAAARLLLGRRLIFAGRDSGGGPCCVELAVGLGEDGGTVLATPRGRLHVGRHEGTFYAYRLEGDDPWLRLLLLALPRLPLCRRPGLAWTDALPVTALGGGWRAMLASCLALVVPPLAVVRTRHRLVGADRVESDLLPGPLTPGRRCSVVLAADGLVEEVAGGGRSLRRVATECEADAALRPEPDHAAA